MKEEGLRGLFRGFGATALRDAPYAGLYVLFYEHSKAMLSGAYCIQTVGEEQPSLILTFSIRRRRHV